ncbi:hypothetical protein [Pseudonocardia xishanensis]|uniref:DUF222 domain-containing protein n=1 Tax=Pseudonocardia xishanensis TaxID=630995 RepID=A0ABP8RTU7_9PSEU
MGAGRSGPLLDPGAGSRPTDGPAPTVGPAADLCGDQRSAAVDALVGLAADALCGADLRRSDMLLSRADVVLGEAERWRPRVRLQWVRAEPALARGELDRARTAAAAAVAGSASAGSNRHLLESRLLAAVVSAVAARRPAADPDALAVALVDLDTLAAETSDAGLLPLSRAALPAAADTADTLRSVRLRAAPPPTAAPTTASPPESNPPPSVIVGEGVDNGPPAGSGQPSDRPIGSPGHHDRRQGGMRGAVNGAPNDAPHRRHAAGLALSVIRARSETVGRRPMGEWEQEPERLAVT